MNESLRILPSNKILSGTPIRVEWNGDFQLSKAIARVRPVETEGGTEAFYLPLSTVSKNQWAAEFTLNIAGHYEIAVLEHKASIYVTPKSVLSFGREFGIFSGATVILVGGMLLWLSRRKRAGSISASGPS